MILEHRGHSLCGYMFRSLRRPHCDCEHHGIWQRCLRPSSERSYRPSPFQSIMPFIISLAYAPSRIIMGPLLFMVAGLPQEREGVSNGIHLPGPHQVIFSFSHGSTIVCGIPSSQVVHKNHLLIRDSPSLGTRDIGQSYASSPS